MMEVKNIITALAGVGGFFLLIASPAKDIWADLLLTIPFFLIFLSRTIHFLLLQYNRLTEQLHRVMNTITLIAADLALVGLLTAKYQAVATFIDFIPFAYYLLVAFLAVLCAVLSIPIIFTKFSEDLNIGDKKIVETISQPKSTNE